ncbi:CHAT domain-containing protein [Nonomuraea sp. KM88]|uniref:CHAT domain-containing protein n=1 Tax=Nonomuraea sp. KM88 TaxID=3457427 RepID=UPI003FCECF53
MTDPAEALAARIERFEQAADPELIWDPAALAEAEEAMRACAGDRSDAAAWRLIGMLHLARYRLDQRVTQDAAVAGAFFAAVALLDPGRLPERLRGSSMPSGDSAAGWAGLVEEIFRLVDPGGYPHVGLLIEALVRHAVARPGAEEVAERLGELLLQESVRPSDPARSPEPARPPDSASSPGPARAGDPAGSPGPVRPPGTGGADEPAGASGSAEPEPVGPEPERDRTAGSAGPDGRMRTTGPAWAPRALSALGNGLVRLHEETGAPEAADDAVHLLFRAALADPVAHTGELADALSRAAPGDEELVRAYLRAAQSPPGSQDRSQALRALVDLTRDRADRSLADGDLLAFIRVGQCALDFWHEPWSTSGVVAPYATGLVEWYVVTGDERSLEAGTEMLEAIRVTPGETIRGLGADPVARLVLLGERRRRRYAVTGDLADLDAAVDAAREGAALAPTGHPERARLLAGLANALLDRAVTTGGDPAEPVAAAHAALAAQDRRHAARAEVLLLLGRALRLRLTTESADEAVTALREALAAGDRPALRAEAYRLISEVLRWRAERAGRTQDLDDAVDSARQAAELALKIAWDPAPAQQALGEALLARFSARGDADDLSEALILATPIPAPAAAGGGSGLLPRLGDLLDGLVEQPEPAAVDERLAQAATELALRSPDEETAGKLLRLAERRTRAPGERGEHLLQVASRLAELGRPHLAGDVLARACAAFEEAGSRSRMAYALSEQGAGEEDAGRLDRALEAYERSAALYRELGEPGSEALQLGRKAAVHLRSGDPAGAVEEHLRAIALCEDAGLAAEEASHQERAAGAHLAAGDPAAAVARTARARELYAELGETERAAMALVPAARAAVDQGDLTAAGERITACARELEAAGAWEEACRTLDAHAVMLAGRGHRAQAAACETRLVEIVRRRGRRREPADEWYRIAQRRRERGDTAGARFAFELAEREYEAAGHDDGAGSVRYNLGALAYAEGEPQRALEYFGAAAEALARLRAPAKESTALTMRAACLAVLDRAEDASADLDRASELAAVAGDREALLTAALGRAALDVRLGDLREAAERLRSALGPAAGDPVKEAVVRDRLAALAALTGDVPAQVTALEQAMAGYREGGQDRLAALASTRLGFALERQGEFRRARAALETGLAGLETAGDVVGVPFEVIVPVAGELDVEVLSRLAAIQLALGDVTRGRATLDQALTTSRAGGGRDARAERLELWLRIEEAEAAGDLPAARTLAEEALTAAERALADPAPVQPDVAGTGPGSAPAEPVESTEERSYLLAKLSTLCRALGDPIAARDHAARGHRLRDGHRIEHLRNLGAAVSDLGRTDEAVRHLAEAVSLARATRSALPAQLVQALDLLGRTLTAQARWQDAANAFDEGLALAAAPVWRALKAPLLAGRAALHLRLDELDEAASRYQQALSISEELGVRTGLADAYADLALVRTLRGEPDEAKPLAERCLTLERAHGRGHGVVLALIALARLSPARAPRLLEEALALAEELGYRPGRALALSRLGARDVTSSSYARARLRLSTAIDLLAELGHDLELGVACHHRSLAAEALGDLPAALADAERAFELGHLPARDRAFDLAVRLGRGLTAWTILERAKLETLAAHLDPPPRPPEGSGDTPEQPGPASVRPGGASRPVPVRGEPGPAAAEGPGEMLEAGRRGLDAVRTLMTAARNTRDPEQAAELIRRAREARADVESSWRRTEPPAPIHVALRLGAPPGRAQLDALVAPGPAVRSPAGTGAASRGAVGLLGFSVGEGAVTVFAHRTGWAEPRVFPTAAGRDVLSDFLAAARERPGLLDVEARRRRADLWKRLADLLLREALQAFGDDLDLVHLLPHAELHGIPLHALAPDGRTLIERFPVAYAPSAAVLARLARRPRAGGGSSLVLGFPRGDGAKAPVEAEAEEVAALLGTRPRTGPSATSALLPGTWDVLHLACHGAFGQGGDPFGSGVRLADGLLTARRLMGMNVDAGLVVLTTHEQTGEEARAQVRGGARVAVPGAEDVAALGHAFLNAGARSALLALWPVAPEITLALLRDFYARRRDGEGEVRALRSAVLGLRELYGSAEPDLWAPYVLVGLPG